MSKTAKKSSDDTYSAKEARERFERALKAGLSTPPKHLKDVPKKRAKKQRKTGDAKRD